MRQENLFSKQIAIYEESGGDLQLLQYLCRELGFKESSCSDASTLESMCESVDAVIVNIDLPKVSLPLNLPVVAIGKQSDHAMINIVRYNPVFFVSKPLVESSIKMGLVKALKVPMALEAYSARLIEIHSFLKEIEYHLCLFRDNDLMNKGLKESSDIFCTSVCPLAKTSEEVKDKIGEYQILEIFNKRGTIVCNQVESCTLRQFVKYLEVKSIINDKVAPFEGLQRRCEEDGFLAQVQFLIKKYNREILDLYQQKKKFCCEICDKVSDDYKHQPGDNLHSDKDEILKGKIMYCNKNDCPLERFFEIQGRKVL